MGSKTPAAPTAHSPDQTPTTPPPPLKERASNTRISPQDPPAVDRKTKPKLVRTSTEEDGYEPVGRQLDEAGEVQPWGTSESEQRDQKPVAADVGSNKIYEDLDSPQGTPQASTKTKDHKRQPGGPAMVAMKMADLFNTKHADKSQSDEAPLTGEDKQQDNSTLKRMRDEEKKQRKQREKEEQEKKKEAKLQKQREKEEKKEKS